MVPSLDWFVYAFVRKEAVLSSQIEGTQATLMDLLTYEATAHRTDQDPSAKSQPEPSADVKEVCNYLDALNFAREQLASPKGLPLSVRLLNETHKRLLSGARGENKRPGKIRKTQNWIGGVKPTSASYVPPPPTKVPDLLRGLEQYIHSDPPPGIDPPDGALPAVVKAGLLHVQLESIHPYLDGNGRIGRLLVTLLLEQSRLLTRPLLYLSLYFMQHPSEYYSLLNAVRDDGDWEAWLEFFLDGVASIADEAVATTRELFALVSRDRSRLLQTEGATLFAAQLFEQLPRHPIVSIPWVVDAFSTTKPTAGRAVDALVKAGVLVEVTGRKRDRSFVYESYLAVLRDGPQLERPAR